MIHYTDIPLLHDNHSHSSLYSAFASCPDIGSLQPDAALSLLEALPQEGFTVVRGWKTNELELSASDLARFPPVLIVNRSLHGFAISDKGLPRIASAYPDIVAGREDPLWREANVPRLFEAYCGLSGISGGKIKAFMDGLQVLGIGSAEDMAVASSESLDAAAKSGCAGRMGFWAGLGLYRSLDAAHRAMCSGVKFFLDGSLGARSAAVKSDWIGGGKGILAWSDGSLREAFRETAGHGTGLAIHAIGETAIDQTLDAIASVSEEGASFRLVRLEHAQFIDKRQAERARELGIILSMQPVFSSDSVDYSDRLDARTLSRNNPFRMLIDQVGFVPGKDLIFGSDGMPHGIGPAAAVSLYPPCPCQRLSLDELVAGFGTARGISGTVTIALDDEARSVSVGRVRVDSGS